MTWSRSSMQVAAGALDHYDAKRGSALYHLLREDCRAD